MSLSENERNDYRDQGQVKARGDREGHAFEMSRGERDCSIG